MQPVIYDVAVSADGFIAGASDDVSRFPHDGPVVDAYLARLKSYSCCLMGRRTYEIGYAYGLKPGDNPYPGMKSVVISKTLNLPGAAQVKVISKDILPFITALRRDAKGPIYLCGGGRLAGWMASMGTINLLRLKRAPVFLGSGVALFGQYQLPHNAKLLKTTCHEGGIVYQEFELHNSG